MFLLLVCLLKKKGFSWRLKVLVRVSSCSDDGRLCSKNPVLGLLLAERLYETHRELLKILNIGGKVRKPLICRENQYNEHIQQQQQQQQQQQPFNGPLSGTTRVGGYQKKHSPAHTHPGQRTSFITFLHLQRSTASSLFSLRAWQCSRTTSFQVLFGLPLGLEPSTSYSMHFFTQSSSFFRSTCPYQRSLFCCNINAMSSTPSLSFSSLLGSLSFSLTLFLSLHCKNICRN